MSTRPTISPSFVLIELIIRKRRKSRSVGWRNSRGIRQGEFVVEKGRFSIRGSNRHNSSWQGGIGFFIRSTRNVPRKSEEECRRNETWDCQSVMSFPGFKFDACFRGKGGSLRSDLKGWIKRKFAGGEKVFSDRIFVLGKLFLWNSDMVDDTVL